jgi:hypothetical protein
MLVRSIGVKINFNLPADENPKPIPSLPDLIDFAV